MADEFDFDIGFFDRDIERENRETEEVHPSDIWDKPIFEIEEKV